MAATLAATLSLELSRENSYKVKSSSAGGNHEAVLIRTDIVRLNGFIRVGIPAASLAHARQSDPSARHAPSCAQGHQASRAEAAPPHRVAAYFHRIRKRPSGAEAPFLPSETARLKPCPSQNHFLGERCGLLFTLPSLPPLPCAAALSPATLRASADSAESDASVR